MKKIKVTQEHIGDDNRSRSPDDCPLARALRSAGFIDVVVAGPCFNHLVNGMSVNTYLPGIATKAIDQYDKSGLMEPFEFELDI